MKSLLIYICFSAIVLSVAATRLVAQPFDNAEILALEISGELLAPARAY